MSTHRQTHSDHGDLTTNPTCKHAAHLSPLTWKLSFPFIPTHEVLARKYCCSWGINFHLYSSQCTSITEKRILKTNFISRVSTGFSFDEIKALWNSQLGYYAERKLHSKPSRWEKIVFVHLIIWTFHMTFVIPFRRYFSIIVYTVLTKEDRGHLSSLVLTYCFIL